MNNDPRFNQEKLTDLGPFRKKKAFLNGAGAVGSYGAHAFAKEAIASLTVNDFDRYEKDNQSKTCSIIRFPEDDGKWKAEALASRAAPIMFQGSATNAINGSIELLGPMAFSVFDYVCTAPDTKAVREYINQQLKQLPAEIRPVFIVGGTDGEMATSAIFTDLDKVCYRCTCEESSFLHARKRTSCADAQYRFSADGVANRIIVSNLSSEKAGLMMADDLREHATGKLHNNRVRVWNPDNPIPIISYIPEQRDNCPTCRRIHPPKEIRMLNGDVLSTSLRTVLTQLREELETDDFNLAVHRHCFGEDTYQSFVTVDYCRACGQQIEVYRHTGRSIPKEKLKCPDCQAHDRKADKNVDKGYVEELQGFSSDENRERLLDMTLFDLGYPIGAFFNVTVFNGAIDACDPRVKRICFAMKGDLELVMKNLNFMEETTNGKV